MLVLSEKDFATSLWSGGTTTELFIYPLGSEYVLRNFGFRLSSARVLAEESVFTPLPGFSRKLALLDGELSINHENTEAKMLSQFGVYSFDGGWKTKAKGSCTDFNLMTGESWEGNVEVAHLNNNDSMSVEVPTKSGWLFIYLPSGKLTLSDEYNELTLLSENLAVVRSDEMTSCRITAENKCDPVVVRVFRTD